MCNKNGFWLIQWQNVFNCKLRKILCRGNISLIVKWIHLLTASSNNWSNVIDVEIFHRYVCHFGYRPEYAAEMLLVGCSVNINQWFGHRLEYVAARWTLSKNQSIIWLRSLVLSSAFGHYSRQIFRTQYFFVVIA